MIDLSKIIISVWEDIGVKFENYKEGLGFAIFYISVPEESSVFNTQNEEMAGEKLAKRFKSALLDMGATNIIVKYRIRKGEHWDKNK